MGPGRSTLTGRRRLDLALFAVAVVLLLYLGPRLRVYYEVTVVEVTVEQVLPDGRRVDRPRPAALDRPGQGRWSGDEVVTRATTLIDEVMATWPVARQAAEGARFEFTIRWSEGSADLDQVARLVWVVPDGDG